MGLTRPTKRKGRTNPSQAVSDTDASEEKQQEGPKFPVRFERSSVVIIIVLTLLALVTRFYRLSEPDEVVFDEVHFGKFVNWYIQGKYFFDIHPPLGKFIIAFAAKFMNRAYDYTGDFPFNYIGDKYAAQRVPFYIERSMPALFSALSVPLLFILARLLRLSKPASVLAAAWLLFDNAVLVQSRHILIDSFLVFFILLSLCLCYFLEQYAEDHSVLLTRRYWYALIATGLAIGCAGSVKWTAFATAAYVALYHATICLATLIEHEAMYSTKRHGAPCTPLHILDVLARGAVLFFAALAVYLLLWYIHFALLPLAGDGDAFMTDAFRSELQGSLPAGQYKGRPLSFLQKVWELNRTMYAANAGITTPHAWQSAWWAWPIVQRGIHFWQGNSPSPPVGVDAPVRRVYLLGNPAVWWGSTAGLLVFVLVALLSRLWTHTPAAFHNRRRLLRCGGPILILWLMNLLPYMLVGRCTFLYHYFPALLCAILLTALLLDYFTATFAATRPRAAVVACALLILPAAFLFGYFSPFVYALPMSRATFQSKVWFPGWS